MARTISGRLVFSQSGTPRSLADFPIIAYCHHVPWPDKKLAEGVTGPDGRFSLDIDSDRDIDLRIELMGRDRTYDKGEAQVVARKLAKTIVPLGADQADLGVVPMGWWPYRTDFPTPRAAPVDGVLPQKYSRGFEKALIKAAAVTTPAKLLLEGINKFNSSKPSQATIQKHQPETLTIRVEKETPGKTRSDEWLADRLLNGFNIALRVGRNADNPAQWRVAIDWGEMAAKGTYDLSEVDVIMEERGDVLAACQISVRNRVPAQGGGSWAADTTTTYTPADGPAWEAAKRIVRCQYLLQGALDGHITTAHFQTEMHALAVFRNLHRNPVLQVLSPHLQEIVAQGKDGDSFAWGPEGILAKASALTVDAMHRRMSTNMAGWDWSTFSPRGEVHATHRYAQAARLFWEVVDTSLEPFFNENAAAIEAHWGEIKNMSDDLVAHSLPYEAPAEDPRVVPFDRNELDDPSVPRVEADGALRSNRPITHTDTPQPGELDKLRQFCRYVIYTATFNHTWTHTGQYDAGGELAYAVFALRNGSIGAEDDSEINPDPAASVFSISTNSLGIHANYGYIIPDEEHDVPPALKAALELQRDAFAKLGVDINTIRSRINI